MNDIKRHIGIFSLTLILSVAVFANEAKAFTEIHISPVDCTITILLRKEFRVLSRQTLNDWLRQTDEAIANAQEVLNPGWFQRQLNRVRSNAALQAERAQAQADLNFHTARRNEIQDIINNYAPMTQAQAEALVQKWKNEIESKWNAQNYLHDGHCVVRVRMVYAISTDADPPKRGFDQIKIVPADYRSRVRGVWNFNANGFSTYPFDNDLTGMWSMNTIDNYTAPHEAGHEMGLKDRYADVAGGGVTIELGYENDLMGGPLVATALQLGALPVESIGNNGLRVNNLQTILNQMSILCPRGGTPQNPRALIDFVPGPARGGDVLEERPKEKCARRSSEPVPPSQPSTETPAVELPAEPTETVQYSEDKLEDVTANTAIVTKDTAEGKEIDVSVLPTGKGIDFRNWEVTDVTLVIDGRKIKPRTKDNFYVDKESCLKGPATLAIVALGAQYKPYVEEAESGKVCPVTGKKIEGSGKKKSHADEAINKAGVATGMGLLASQAKGTITGKKCRFDIDKNTAEKLDGQDDYARITVLNETNNKERTIKVPLR